ncbi:MAG: SRPBCC family protein [Actinomycetota bacterium]
MTETRALDHTIVIAAPPQTVWAMISDLTRMAEWSPHSAGARMGGLGAAPEAGVRFTGRNRNRWHRWNTRCTVVASVPEREIAWTACFFGFSTGYWHYRLEPSDDGCSTTVTESWRDLRTSPLLQFAPLVRAVTGTTDVVAEVDRSIRMTLQELKAAAERSS